MASPQEYLRELGMTPVPSGVSPTFQEYLAEYNATYSRIASGIQNAAQALRQFDPNPEIDVLTGLELVIAPGSQTPDVVETIMQADINKLTCRKQADRLKIYMQLPRNDMGAIIHDLGNISRHIRLAMPAQKTGVYLYDAYSPAPMTVFLTDIGYHNKSLALEETIRYGASVNRKDTDLQNTEFYDDSGFGKAQAVYTLIEPQINPAGTTARINAEFAGFDMTEAGAKMPLGLIRLAILDLVQKRFVKDIYDKQAAAEKNKNSLAKLG